MPPVDTGVDGPHDPVAAYDRIAPLYAELSQKRIAYLDRIDQLVISLAPPDSRSLLDVGSGDARRARKIAQALTLTTAVFVEPSREMQTCRGAQSGFRTMRAEELDSMRGSFDVVTCLWNVLGHISPAASRVEVMRQFARLVAPHGRILVDVNHRYNARHYGWAVTVARFLNDVCWPSEKNGDVVARWLVGETQCCTKGHVFTHREFCALASEAGLMIERRFVVDYGDGRLRKASLLGNLFYALRART